MPKIIYHFDAANGEFLSQGEARESPLEPGEFFMPAFATDIEPPAPATGFVLVFDGAGWTTLREQRGVWFNAAGDSISVDDLQADTAGLVREPRPGKEFDLVQGVWTLNNNKQLALQTDMLQGKVQEHIDSQAQALGYDSAFTAVTYADEPAVAKFQKEGKAIRAWRSLVWQACYTKLGAVVQGGAPVPTAEDLIASLPQLVIPA